MQKSWWVTQILIVLLCWVEPLAAQYYSWGADSPQRWSRRKGDRVEVVYPDSTDALAERVLHYVNAVQRDIAYGFDHPALDIPFVVHPDNFSSNGLVMWMPKRIEFLTTPTSEGNSSLWIKQLVAHEYRHAVQYNNLNRHWIRALSYILGQQGSAIGLVFMPMFALEGDAVLMETEMVTYGRGLQPSFSMEYRAIGDDIFSRRNVDKWFCGSYRENIPDHYHIGYQFMSYAYEKYRENIWNKAVWYTTRNPYMAFSSSSGLKRYYDTSVERLSREAFAELNELWRPLSEVPNSTDIISRIDTTNYTTYSHPMAMEDGRVLSLKSSFNRTPRFVIYSQEGESVVAKIGSLSARPSYSCGRVWWTEYRRSKLFDEKVGSQLCYMDVEDGRPRWVKGINQALFAEPVHDDIAYVEYAPSGRYSVVVLSGMREVKRLEVPFPTEIHGLAWDDTTQKLYIIATSQDGMWLGVESENGFTPLHEGRYITLSALRAVGGVLYFGSIASGLDELHSYDVASGVERQITRSTYGSFQPSRPTDSYIYATTYDRYGYHLSRQCVDETVGEVTPGRIPHNLVNPERRSLGLINLDTLRFESVDSMRLAQESPARRYRKGRHLVDVHSWVPARFNPFKLIDEQILDVGFGATLISQNLLSSTEGYLAYGYDRVAGSTISGSMSYTGLGVVLSTGVSYGGQRQYYSKDDSSCSPTDISNSNYLSLSAMASLPLYYQRGYLSRQLTLWSGWNFSNGLVEDLNSAGEYNSGLHKLSFGAGFGTYAQQSYRDFVTPLGYYISGSYAINPTNRDFCSMLSTYAKVYLPGVFAHNSLTIAASYQTNVGDGYTYRSAYILPRGYQLSDIINDDYIASELNYYAPVWYPDGGIEGVLYFKRVILDVGAQYAQYNNYLGKRSYLYSYGGGVTVDVNVLRLPDSGTSQVRFSIYKPRNRRLNYELGLSLPI